MDPWVARDVMYGFPGIYANCNAATSGSDTMTTVSTDQLTETIQNYKQAADDALSSPTIEQFVDFEKFTNEVAGFVRETQQSMWQSEAKETIKNLETGRPLSPADHDIIRTFLVSDAEHYLKHENNFGDWKNELSRIVDDLSARVSTVDRHTIADMRGVLSDAIRLVPDIRNYLEEQGRVKKFEAAVETFDDSSRAMLAKLMKEQLQSTKR
jgi:hypothetical protein